MNQNIGMPPRIALRCGEAAQSLGVSEDFFATNIAPELRCVRRGRVKLYPLAELERWLADSATKTLDEDEL